MVNDFIYVSPESEGLPSKKVKEFIDIINFYKINVHSFMVVRNGKILAEAYAHPYFVDFKHRLYSCSKTYAAMAVGKLVKEGLVKVTDKFYDYFPELTQGKTYDSERLNMTIEDLLKMSVPFGNDTYSDKGFRNEPWVPTYFEEKHKTVKKAGAIFEYNTSSSFMLDVLVEKLTGKKFLEYMRPELDEIGVAKDIFCVESPDGYSWGGSGVCCTTRDFAKFAELIMHMGNHNGKQLLPYDYVKNATTKRIDTIVDNAYNYDCYGYGYQIWITPEGGFAFNGMGCQFAHCYPSEDFMVVINSDTQSSARVFGTLLHLGVMNMKRALTQSLSENESDYNELKEAINNFSLHNGYGEKTSPIQNEIQNKKYTFSQNSIGLKWCKFSFEGDEGTFTYENARGVKQIKFGMEKHVFFEFPETHYYHTRMHTPKGRGYICMGNGAFTSQDTLLIRINAVDVNLGHIGILANFNGKTINVKMTKVAEEFFHDYKGYAIGTQSED